MSAQKKTTNLFLEKIHKYFWALNNGLPDGYVDDYAEAVKKRPAGSELRNIISLLSYNVPILPRVYITPKFSKNADNQKLTSDCLEELSNVISHFEDLTNFQFSGENQPLLLSVHHSYSSVRNIGCSPATLPGLVRAYGRQNAFATYLDFLSSYTATVLECHTIDFLEFFNLNSNHESTPDDLSNLSENEFLNLVESYQLKIQEEIGTTFPKKSEVQLVNALIKIVNNSNTKTKPDTFITTCRGKLNSPKSLLGVAFTRHPFSGKIDTYGVYERGGSNEKISIEESKDSNSSDFCQKFPEIHSHLLKYLPKIEKVYRSITEVGFVTDDSQNTYFTSFEKASSTSEASITATMALHADKAINDTDAVCLIDPEDIESLLHPSLDEQTRSKLTDLGSKGLVAARGTVSGKVFFRMDDAIAYCKKAEAHNEKASAILITDELMISESAGISTISGLITTASGIASHAAVMARANGLPCIVGYENLTFDRAENSIYINKKKISAQETITMEATDTGRLYLGQGKSQNLAQENGLIKSVAKFLNEVIEKQDAPVRIRINVNNAKEVKAGLAFGADSVGLCRTENMFVHPEAIKELRNIIFTEEAEDNKSSFEKLEKMQQQDFEDIFEALKGRKANIRLMDMPIHELIPRDTKELNNLIKTIAKMYKIEPNQVEARIASFEEANPMLGLRACRLGIIKPDLYIMQIRAILNAAYEVVSRGGTASPGIMFPLVYSPSELRELRKIVIKVEREVSNSYSLSNRERPIVRMGTMIELPSAALHADQLAPYCDFFAFGTNDLTQTTLGISRDDCMNYFPQYMELGVLNHNPFKVLDPAVKSLIEIAVSRGKRIRPDLSVGICGEQGADFETLGFCLDSNINYISCSPYRVLPALAMLAQKILKRRD